MSKTKKIFESLRKLNESKKNLTLTTVVEDSFNHLFYDLGYEFPTVDQLVGDISRNYEGYEDITPEEVKDELEYLGKEIIEESLIEKIVKQDGKWLVKSEDGSKVLGTFDTKEEAEKRLKQIEFFKHKNESDDFIIKYYEDWKSKLESGRTRLVSDLYNSNKYLFGYAGKPKTKVNKVLINNPEFKEFEGFVPEESDAWWRVEFDNDSQGLYYKEFGSFGDLISFSEGTFEADDLL